MRREMQEMLYDQSTGEAEDSPIPGSFARGRQLASAREAHLSSGFRDQISLMK